MDEVDKIIIIMLSILVILMVIAVAGQETNKETEPVQMVEIEGVEYELKRRNNSI